MKRTMQLGLSLSICLLFLLNEQPVRSATPPQAAVDWRFGIIESYQNPVEAGNLGVAWTRVRFHWAHVQAGGPGTWTPNVDETLINGEVAAGRTLVGLLIGVPDWAWDGGLPQGLWLPHDDPNNTWGNYVREAVSRYNGRINHWIIWNEPDVNDPNAPGYTWAGSINDFFQLQRTAYLVAKEANPNAVIHLPAFTHFWNPNYIYDFLDIVVADPSAPGNNYYFDAVTAHLYFQPEAIFNIIQQFYGAVATRGIPWKPVWLVETNAPPSDDPTWPVPNWTFQVTQQEQAAFIPQALAVALAAGAQRVAVYKMQDTAEDVAANPEPFGLLRMDGSRRPAFNSYQVAIRYLAGMQGVKRERWDAVGQIWLDQGTHTTTVLFSRLPAAQVADVAATANTAVLVDMWGGRQSIAAANGVFTVNLPGAPCVQTAGDYCMIGGAPYYLVQATEGGAPPAPPPVGGPPPSTPSSATVTPEPDAPTNTPDFTDTPSPTAEATETPEPTATHTMTPTATPTDGATVTNTPVATATVALTQTPVPATAVVALMPTTIPTAAPVPETAVTPGNLSYLFIIGGIVLALGLGGWWYLNGRRR
jgi:hypothetical protein